jgi:hypothetical protein
MDNYNLMMGAFLTLLRLLLLTPVNTVMGLNESYTVSGQSPCATSVA